MRPTIEIDNPRTKRANIDRFWARLPYTFSCIPERQHLAFLMEVLEELDKLGFDFSAHGDCIIEAIAGRMQTGEW